MSNSQQNNNSKIYLKKTLKLIKDYVNNQKEMENENNFWIKNSLASKLFLNITARPEEFYGNSIVDYSLKKDAKNTATVVTVSNWINFIFTLPLFFYASNFYGIFFGVIMSFIGGAFLVSFANAITCLAAKRSSNNQILPTVAAIGMISINAALTVGSILGAELSINTYVLANNIAEKEADKSLNSLEIQKNPQNSQYYINSTTVKKECKDGERQLNELPLNSYRRNQLYLQIRGTYDQWVEWRSGKKGILDIPDENISGYPKCIQDIIYDAKLTDDVGEANKEYSNLKKQRTKMGNDIEFLRVYFPSIYNKNFSNNDSIKNGAAAISASITNFFQKISSPEEIGELGFSLFLASLSLITSSYGCLAVVLFSLTDKTKKSYSLFILEARDKWLNEVYNLLLEFQEEEKKKLEQEDPQKYSDQINALIEKHNQQENMINEFFKIIKERGIDGDFEDFYDEAQFRFFIENKNLSDNVTILLFNLKDYNLLKIFVEERKSEIQKKRNEFFDKVLNQIN